jgi:hypothetical protein
MPAKKSTPTTLPPRTLWRVEARVPAIRNVYARTKEEATAKACDKLNEWFVDLDATLTTSSTFRTIPKTYPEDE